MELVSEQKTWEMGEFGTSERAFNGLVRATEKTRTIQ